MESINNQAGRNIWYYGIDLFLVFGISFILNILYANYISVDEYAKFSIIWAMMNLISVITILGIPRAFLKRIPELELMEKKRLIIKYFIVSLFIILGASLIFGPIAGFLGALLFQNIINVKPGLDLLIFLIIFQPLNLTSYYFLMALKRMNFSLLGNIIKYGLYFCISWAYIFIYSNLSYIGPLVGFIIGTIVSFLFEVIMIIYQVRRLSRDLKFPNFDDFKQISRDIFPLGISWILASFSGIFIFSYGIIFLSTFIPNLYDISSYNISSIIAQAFYCVPTIIIGALFPYFSSIYKKNIQEFRKFFNSSLKISIILSLILTIFGFIFADRILFLLSSNKYISAVPILQILLIGMFLFGLNNTLILAFYIFEKLKMVPFLHMSIILTYTGLSFLFSLFFESTIAVAIALTVGNLLIFILLSYLVKIRLNMNILNKEMSYSIIAILIPISLAALILISIKIYYNNLILDLIFFSIGVLISLFLVLKRFNPLDFYLIKIILQKKREVTILKSNKIVKPFKYEKIRHYSSKNVVLNYEKLRFNNIFGYLQNKFQKYLILQKKISDNQIGLDIATGTGRFLFEIARKVNNVIGIDTSFEMLKYVREKNKRFKFNNLNLIASDIEYLPIRSNSIELISAIHIFIHLKRFSKLFSEVRRVLKNHGSFVFDIYNKNFLPRRFLNKLFKRNYKFSQLKIKDLRNITLNFKELKIKSIKGIGIIIIYLFPSRIKKLVSLKHYNSIFFKILLRIEQIFTNKLKIINYCASDLLIQLEKSS